LERGCHDYFICRGVFGNLEKRGQLDLWCNWHLFVFGANYAGLSLLQKN
jgi:hypothetical protein